VLVSDNAVRAHGLCVEVNINLLTPATSHTLKPVAAVSKTITGQDSGTQRVASSVLRMQNIDRLLPLRALPHQTNGILLQ
jgi:hypothetical protein